NDFGCMSEDSVEVRNPLEIEFDRRDYSICFGESIVIGPTASATDIQFTWSPAVFLSDSQIRNPQFTGPGPGIYTYEVLAEKDGCSNTFEVNIIVSDPGTLNLSFESASICMN